MTSVPIPKRMKTRKQIDPGLVIDSWCDAHGWERPTREFQFAAPLREWRFDYAWPRLLIALELDGAVWARGRHTRGGGFLGDLAKFNEAALRGWIVLRVETKAATSERTRGLMMRAMSVRNA